MSVARGRLEERCERDVQARGDLLQDDRGRAALAPLDQGDHRAAHVAARGHRLERQAASGSQCPHVLGDALVQWDVHCFRHAGGSIQHPGAGVKSEQPCSGARRLAIASRADPPLPLARLRARGELVEIRAADLRFTPDEAAGVPQRGDGPGPDGTTTSPRWRRAPKAGSPDCSWRRSRCRGATTSPASSPASPGTTATSWTTWSKRSCSASPNAVRSFLLQTSILDRLSGPLCDAVTGQDGRQGACWRRWSAATCSSFRWMTGATGIAITTSLPTCSRAHLLDEQPDQVATLHRRASAWYEQNGERPRRSATRWPPRISRARRTWSSWPCRPCAGVDRRPRCWAGSRRSPTSWSAVRPVLSAAYAGALLASGELEGVEARLRDAERWLDPTADMACATGRPSGGDGRRGRRGISPSPGCDRRVPCRTGPGSGRCGRHREICPAGARPRP